MQVIAGLFYCAMPSLKWFLRAGRLTLVLLVVSAHANAETFSFEFKPLAPWQTWMKNAGTEVGTRFELPGVPDVNHIDGIGVIYLVTHLPMLAAGAQGPMDLRNASITIRLKATGVNLHNGKLAWWVVGDIPKDRKNPNFAWQQTNWAYTGKTFGQDALGDDGTWTTLSVVLDPAPANWTYAGTNTSTQGVWGKRYERYSIGKTLSNVSATLHFLVLGADNPPEGVIEIDSVNITTMPAPDLPDYSDLVILMKKAQWAEAVPGLKLLADNGHSGAAYHYANVLNYGMAGDPDICTARAYYAEAESKEVSASVELAITDMYGICGSRDYRAAFERVKRNQSDPRSRYLMARMLLNGVDGEPDRNSIMQHLLYAANRGYVLAMGDLGLMFADEGNDEDALFWLSLAEKRSDESDPRKNYLFAHVSANLRESISDSSQARVLSRVQAWEPASR
jgi:hypothetical protein